MPGSGSCLRQLSEILGRSTPGPSCRCVVDVLASEESKRGALSATYGGRRDGQTACEVARAFLVGLGDWRSSAFGDFRHNRVALARRLDLADPRPVVSTVSLSMPDDVRVEASMRESQMSWDAAGACLEELRIEGVDAPWGQTEP